ncbi:MAG: hypothetical protein ACJ746_13615 [Bryobacteraceae bacterium]
MPNLTDETRNILQRSRSLADEADVLGIALRGGDTGRIENAAEDLAAAYDRYAGQTGMYTGRLRIDEPAALQGSDTAGRDTYALTSALLDLHVAAVMAGAADAAAGDGRAEYLDEAITSLNETIKSRKSAARTSRLGFDEVTAAPPAANRPSVDFASARNTYVAQVERFYESLLAETSSLLNSVFEKVGGLNADTVDCYLSTIFGSLEGIPGDKLLARAWSAVQRAIDTLRSFAGSEILDSIQQRVKKVIGQIRNGTGALTLFLIHAFQSDDGRHRISGWLESTRAELAVIDEGSRKVNALRDRMMENFALLKRIVETLHMLRKPAEWLLGKLGGTLPLDVAVGGAFLLVMNVGILRGMDYADTTSIVKLVDGVLVITKEMLGVG